MKKTLILASFLALAPFAKGQLLLEALDAPNAFTSTQTRSYNGSFSKNDCTGADYRGTSVTFTQSATATATSYTSQQDADNKAANEATAEAQRLVNQGGQAHANQHGSCDYYGSKPNCHVIMFHPELHGGRGGVSGHEIVSKNQQSCYDFFIAQILEKRRQGIINADSTSRIQLWYDETKIIWSWGFLAGDEYDKPVITYGR